MSANRRTTLKLLGGATLMASVTPLLPAGAQQTRVPTQTSTQVEEFVVPNTFQNFKRGTIHSIDTDARSFVIIWEDLGTVKMKAADLVANFRQLRVGQTVDVNWYNYVDFMIARTTSQVTKRAEWMVAHGARLGGLPGSQQRMQLWQMAGMCTKIDPVNGIIFLINASGGEPGRQTPASGEVVEMPQIVTPGGRAALAKLKPGDYVTTVFSQQTAISVGIVR